MRLFLSFLAVFTTVFAVAQSHQKICWDLTLSEYFGANNLQSAHRLLYLSQDKYIPDTLFREHTFWRKTGGFAYRMLRFGLFDAQIDYLTALAQHEVFGHGARYRELGYEENSFHLSLFFPYGDGSGFARTGSLKSGYRITRQEQLAKIIAGNEGNQVLSDELAAQMLIGDAIHYRQASLYLISHNNLASYIWYSRLRKSTSSSDDIQSYLFEMNSLYGLSGTTINIEDLSKQCLVSLLSPLQLYSAYAILIKYGVQAKKGMNRIPMIRLGKLRYLPEVNYSLTPFGSQYHLIQHFAFSKRLISANIGIGDHKFYPFYGVNAICYNLIKYRFISLNVAGAFWSQPEIEGDDYSLRNFSVQPGGAIKSDLFIRPLKLPYDLGLYLQLGYKTKGYLPGEDLREAWILRAGISGTF